MKTNLIDSLKFIESNSSPSSNFSCNYSDQCEKKDNTIYPNKYHNTNGTKTTLHIYNNKGSLVSSIEKLTSSQGIIYIHTDHLGGTSTVTNQTPGEVQTIDYYPFGKIRINSKTGTFDEKRKFTGHEYDNDSNLHYANARYYNQGVARFVSQDPVFLSIGNDGRVASSANRSLESLLIDPQMLNSYSYATNNPIKNVDPDGNVSMSALLLSPIVTIAQLGIWGAGSQYLSSSRPASSAMMQHSLSINPQNITINEGTQVNYGNIIDQIKNSSEFNKYLSTALSNNQDAVYSESGFSGSLKFSGGDLSTSLGKAGISIIGNKENNSVNVQVKDLYNYEMHAGSDSYKGSLFFNTLNNLANVSQNLGIITPYNTTINFSAPTNQNEKK